MPAPELQQIRGTTSIEGVLEQARAAQQGWAARPLTDRLIVIRKTRHHLARECRSLAALVPGRESTRPSDHRTNVQSFGAPTSRTMLPRNLADTLIAEVLPLAEAARFLEREAGTILRARQLGRRHRPFWLRGVEAKVDRVPLGVVLVIAPSNYPLFLPGVQVLQAVAAGNAVLWKPAVGCSEIAKAFARIMEQAGLPIGLLHIIDEQPKAGVDAMRAGVDKVFLTGHEHTGHSVLQELAAIATPAVMELSGCDAVFVLPGADLKRVAHALAFGMRLNGSATCMAPRRVFATEADTQKILPLLQARLAETEPVSLPASVRHSLDSLLRDVQNAGATLVQDGRIGGSDRVRPTLLCRVPAGAALLRTDIFAPVLSFCPVVDSEDALRANALCPYALTGAVFGEKKTSGKFAARLRVGTVLINDLIVSTADPRVPFGGRGASGFGVTRGCEGLLEMTAVKTTLHQKDRSLRPYAATGSKHEPFFAGYIQAVHSSHIRERVRAFARLLSTARHLEK